jgi:hypothetical protein
LDAAKVGGTVETELVLAPVPFHEEIVNTLDMKLTNDSYLILLGTKNFTEQYYRDKDGWLKESARGRRFRMTAEQVLNHLLPAVAGLKPNLIVKVIHQPAKRSAPGSPRERAMDTSA